MVEWSLFHRGPLFDPRKFKRREKVLAFIQARQGSTRLPNKIYREINGAPMLYHTINMAKRAALIDDVVVVSPQKLPDVPEGITEFVYDGDEMDVVGRYYHALKANPCDYIVRLTSDCPILDSYLIDYVIAASLGADYGSNVLVPTFPDGMDTEVISANTMAYLYAQAETAYDREHVTTLLRREPLEQIRHNMVSVQACQDHSYLKLSVDTEEDFQRVCEMEKNLSCLR